jgi:hypothetical protein
MSLRRTLSLTVLAALLSVVALAPAQPLRAKLAPKAAVDNDPGPSLATAHGTVSGSDKDSITVKPRAANGQFGKELVLKVTGTTRVTQLGFQTQAGKTVARQTDVDVKDLKPQQSIAVIYTQIDSGPVLLSATVLPAAK